MPSLNGIGNVFYFRFQLNLHIFGLLFMIYALYNIVSALFCASFHLRCINRLIILKWDQPDLNRRPPAPEAGIIPS